MGDRYIIDFQAETRKAEADLKKLINKVSELDRIGEQASSGFMEGTEANIAKTNKKYQEMVSEVTRLTGKLKQLQEEANKMGDPTSATKLGSELAKVAMAQDNATKAYNKASTELGKSYDSMLEQAKAIEKYRESLKGATEDTVDMKVASKELNKVINQTTTTMGKIQRGATMSGTDARNYTEGRKYYNEVAQTKPMLEDKIVGYNDRLSGIARERKDLQSNTNMDRKDRDLKLAMLKEEQTAVKEKVKATRKLTKAIEDAEAMYKTVDGGGSGGSGGGGGGFDYSGMAEGPKGPKGGGGGLGKLVGALAMVKGVGSAFSGAKGYLNEGRAYNLDMGRQAVSIGKATGDYDERGIRKSAREFGTQKDISYSGTDVLDFYTTTLGGMGHQDSNRTQLMAEEQASMSRGLNIDKAQYKDVMSDVMKTGAIESTTDIADITKAIQGGLTVSGMVGRDKESVQALNALVKNRTEGRTATKEEYENTVALQTILASTGAKGLQGEQGADAIGGLDDLFKSDDQLTQFLLGYGTEFQGLGGRYEYEKMVSGGATPELLDKFITNLKNTTGGAMGDKEMAVLLDKATKGTLGIERSEELIKLHGTEGLTKDNVEKVKEDMKSEGDKSLKDNKEAFKESDVALKENTDAKKLKQRSEANDSAIGRGKERVDNALGGISGTASMIGKTVFDGATTAGMYKLFTGGFSKFGKGGATATAEAGEAVSKASRFTNMTEGFTEGLKDTAGKAGGVAPKATGFVSNMGSKLGTFGETLGGKAMGALGKEAKTASTVTASATKSGGALGAISKGLGKVAVPVGAVMSAVNIAKADDKIKAVGKEGGAWAGAGAGASLGAGAGTAVLPGIGTAIGGLVGGIGGAIGGSSLGGWVGDKASSAWQGTKNFFGFGDKDKKKTDGGKEKAGEKAKSDKRDSAERRRSDNVKKETENLAKYEQLLQKAGAMPIAGGGNSEGYSADAKSRTGGGDGDDDDDKKDKDKSKSKDKDKSKDKKSDKKTTKSKSKSSSKAKADKPVQQARMAPMAMSAPMGATNNNNTVIQVTVDGAMSDADAKRKGRIVGDEINKRTADILNNGGKAMKRK